MLIFLALILAVLQLVFNYASKTGANISKKINSDGDTSLEDGNIAMMNSWLKSNLISIAWRAFLVVAGLVILLIYDPRMLPWG
jgi:hypothetical protein